MEKIMAKKNWNVTCAENFMYSLNACNYSTESAGFH